VKSRDIIVIGASAGGLQALLEIVGALPQGFSASIFVVMHLSPYAPSSLPEILSSAGHIKAFHARDGEKIQSGRIYVASPDRHLILEKNAVFVKNGPKENRFRPSVDALFRSAAYTYGPRVIGVVLSGALDDGTSGLWTIKRLGGVTIIQDPAEATFPQMPENALQHVEVDHTVRSAEIGTLLNRLTTGPMGKVPKVAQVDRKRIEMEIKIAADDDAFERGVMEIGDLTPFTCPECHGALVRLKEGSQSRFRCHTGHAYSASSLLASVTRENEELLWQAMRSLEETTMLLNHIGQHFADTRQAGLAKLFRKKARECGKRARVIHDAVLEQELLSEESINDKE
jgi:two-component system, chemotaxis family, protein-glutamate methylesterase/glutaminase